MTSSCINALSPSKTAKKKREDTILEIRFSRGVKVTSGNFHMDRINLPHDSIRGAIIIRFFDEVYHREQIRWIRSSFCIFLGKKSIIFLLIRWSTSFLRSDFIIDIFKPKKVYN